MMIHSWFSVAGNLPFQGSQHSEDNTQFVYFEHNNDNNIAQNNNNINNNNNKNKRNNKQKRIIYCSPQWEVIDLRATL